jgi:hypothetical protein
LIENWRLGTQFSINYPITRLPDYPIIQLPDALFLGVGGGGTQEDKEKGPAKAYRITATA